MCRLIGYAGRPIGLDRLIFEGDHSLYRQSFAAREMISGTVNVDGYGVAWFPGPDPVRVAEARPLWHDPDLRPLLRSVQPGLALGAIRSATPGIPVDRSAVAPMIHGRWAFALNGYIWDFRRSAMRQLHTALPDHLHGSLRGVSDTEALFLTAVARLEEGASLGEGLRHALDVGREAASAGGVDAQLNLALTDGTSIVFSRASSGNQSNSLYWREGSSLAPGGTLIASEPPVPSEAWDSVPEEHLIRISAGQAPVIEPI